MRVKQASFGVNLFCVKSASHSLCGDTKCLGARADHTYFTLESCKPYYCNYSFDWNAESKRKKSLQALSASLDPVPKSTTMSWIRPPQGSSALRYFWELSSVGVTGCFDTHTVRKPPHPWEFPSLHTYIMGAHIHTCIYNTKPVPH